MARIAKISALTPKPKTKTQAIHVYAKNHNELIDVVNDITSEEGVLVADLIVEKTSGAGTSIALPKSTVTQGTNITTGVTINAQSGVITTVSLTTAASTVAGPFVVTNSACLATSVIQATVQYANGKTGFPVCLVEAVAAGSFNIRLINVHTSAALNDVVKIHFAIL